MADVHHGEAAARAATTGPGQAKQQETPLTTNSSKKNKLCIVWVWVENTHRERGGVFQAMH